MSEQKTPLEMFYHWEATTPEMVFLRQAENLEWREYTWGEFSDQVRRVASFIVEQGYPAGSRIAILSSNSVDWFVVDLAIMLSGHVSVPLYPGQDIDSARYILEHSETQMIFVGQFNKAAEIDAMMPESVTRVAMRGNQTECQYTLADIIATYPPYTESPVPNTDDLMTLLYTSGTTGRPKGVMHTHGTPAKVVPRMTTLLQQKLGTDERGRFFSYLPLSHAAERIIVEMLSLYTNPTVSFSEGLTTFADELRAVKPTMFFSVPRLWVRFKEGVDAAFPPEVQATFGEDEKAFVRSHLGLDQAKVIITGSAPTPKDVQQWFIDMGIMLRDGYGMTENFIDGANYSEGVPEPGCVGKSGEGVEIKITEAGEICFKSDGLMKGYYKDPEKTAEVLVDGWYHTGDRGRIDENGNLWVTGRISEVFKTSKGKFVVPTALEDRFASVSDIAQLMLFGHGRDQPLLVANLSELARKQSREAIEARMEEALDAINAELSKHERIAQVFIANDEWTIDNALLTPTMKLKRRAIEDRYADLVEARLGESRVVWE
jgi:long-chain acyl-CoA synthetase